MISGFAVAILAAILNTAFSVNILAPELISGKACQSQVDLVSQERLDELFQHLPSKGGQTYRQIFCKHTNMMLTSYYTVTLGKVWKEDNTTYNTNISYYANDRGEQANYFPSEPFFYLLAPLLFAYLLSRNGQTPGKKLMNLTVYNDDFQKPNLITAIKKEYFKAVLFVIAAGFSIYSMMLTFNQDLDETAKQLATLTDSFQSAGFSIWMIAILVVSIATFWFQFGSFIRWRGRSYWDQFAKLNTSLVDDYAKQRGLKDDNEIL